MHEYTGISHSDRIELHRQRTDRQVGLRSGGFLRSGLPDQRLAPGGRSIDPVHSGWGHAKENFELVASANQKLIGRLTDVLDNFELAFDPRHKAKDDRVEDFEKGVRLIYSKFKELLTDEGLEEIDPSGQEFDPNLHDALMQQPSDTVPENRIIQVLSKGYKVKGRILKHAKVIVSKGKE